MRCVAVVLLGVVGCGRVGFDDLADAGRDATHDSTGTPAVAWVGVAVGHGWTNGSTDTFTLQAVTAGDVVLIAAVCSDTTSIPTSVSLAAPGWTFTSVDGVVEISGFYETMFVAIAPDTAATTAVVTWPTTCKGDSDEMGDEFNNASPILDAHVQTTGLGNCAGTVTTAHADDALWACCNSSLSVTGVGPGFAMGAMDMQGDLSEHETTDAPAGTPETATILNAGNQYAMEVVALAPE